MGSGEGELTAVLSSFFGPHSQNLKNLTALLPRGCTPTKGSLQEAILFRDWIKISLLG